MPECNTCHRPFSDYHELAVHIMSNKKTHKYGRKWAAKVIGINGLSMKARNGNQFEGRVALTDEQKEAKQSTRAELSGEVATVYTLCPRCKVPSIAQLPVEYTQSDYAWRVNDKYVVICRSCR